MQDKKIVVFDGVCILCNGFVQWMIQKDRKKQFYFSTAQSVFIENYSKAMNIPMRPMESVIYIRNGKVLTESQAILMIFHDLGGPWKFFTVLRICPSFIRDLFYRMMAKRRYAMFGKKDECMIPTGEIKARFILD